MVKEKDNFLNYALSIGFVLLIIFFISSLAFISRVVLSNDTPIGVHVSSTKDLLDDISEVEKSTHESVNETISQDSDITEGSFFEIDYKGFNIEDLSYLNLKEDKSFLTIEFDSQINSIGGVYYVDLNNISGLRKGNMLVYERDGIIKLGKFVSFDEESLVLIDEDNKKNVVIVAPQEIVGRVFLIRE